MLFKIVNSRPSFVRLFFLFLSRLLRLHRRRRRVLSATTHVSSSRRYNFTFVVVVDRKTNRLIDISRRCSAAALVPFARPPARPFENPSEPPRRLVTRSLGSSTVRP